MNIFQVTLVAILTVFFIIQCLFIIRKYKLNIADRAINSNTIPDSLMSHGMVLTEDKKSVKSVETKSPTYYQMLE